MRQIFGSMKIASSLLLMALGATPCPASLVWQIRDLALKTEIGQETAVAVFPFRNAGDQPVRIVSLDPSCGCMAAEPGKWVYAPGETGEIRVQMALAGYVGHLRRSVAVETDDAAQRFVELTMTLDIPEPVAIAPRFLFWRVGDAAAEKSVEITVAEPAKTSLAGVTCDSDAFTAALQPDGGGRYRLAVKPAGTGQAVDSAVRLKAEIGGRPQIYIVYVAVK